MMLARRLPARLAAQPVRRLHVHEYQVRRSPAVAHRSGRCASLTARAQCQQIMQKHGIAVPRGFPATTVDGARKAAEQLGGANLVIKAQILAGGRGLGRFDSGLEGGVHLCDSADEVERLAERMLRHTLVTKQTGAAGRVVHTVFISERYTVQREMYFAIMLDRSAGGPVMIASPKGGVNIEDVARDSPEFIFKEPVDPSTGPTHAQCERLAAGLCADSDASPAVRAALSQEIARLWNLFYDTDASMLEINPLAELANDKVLCLDAKVNFDDNAEFRQKEIFQMRDLSQEDAREVRAAAFDLNYIGLDGNIGCLVNGAGLAMATMDIIQYCGGSPANFLDVGGGATREQVREAIKILSDDAKVEAILINIFGGIAKCDLIANGVLDAAEEIGLTKPLVVRLEGTNVDQAKEILAHSKLDISIEAADDLLDAAQKAVRAAKGK